MLRKACKLHILGKINSDPSQTKFLTVTSVVGHFRTKAVFAEGIRLIV